ncbi:hypothetical protein HA402_016027 [Bradysia odoriphaga]|nr:hypothetical protein HA402_016027 [Bradysia odoriphaga]
MLSLKCVSILTLLALLSTLVRAFHVGLTPAFKQFPYSALIVANYNDSTNNLGNLICSGTLVNINFVITSTWCIRSEKSKNFRIKLGVRYLTTDVNDEFVYDHIITNAQKYDSDDRLLTLIRLDSPANFSREIQPISFPPTSPISQLNDAIDANYSAILVGWTTNEEVDAEEKWLPSVVKNVTDCPGIDVQKALCAEGETIDGKSSNLCVNAGATLVIFNTVFIGIGLDVCVENGPQKFARVSAYVEWIKSVLLTSKYGTR